METAPSESQKPRINQVETVLRLPSRRARRVFKDDFKREAVRPTQTGERTIELVLNSQGPAVRSAPDRHGPGLLPFTEDHIRGRAKNRYGDKNNPDDIHRRRETKAPPSPLETIKTGHELPSLS